ncbi:hypothetical protein [Streptomyces noursei]|uniref:hypothetical protein n=1 Tax=Streptomyces noursei TaxID=1971 RepID=UPI00381D3A46
MVTLHVDELRQAQMYRPADLAGTEFRAGEVAQEAEAELVAFFDQSGEEAARRSPSGWKPWLVTRSYGTANCCATDRGVRSLGHRRT